MRSRTVLLVAVAVVMAACGGTDAEGESAARAAAAKSPEATTTASAGTTSTTQPVTTTAAPIAERGTRDEPVAVGEPVRVGNWVLRVAGVTADGTDIVMAANEFNEPPGEGEQFFLAALEATYVGAESSSFWVDMTLKPVGASNVAYESFNAYCGLAPDPIDESGETFPGGTITGNACWKIDGADAESLVMIAEESFSFEDTRAFLSLDPAAVPVEATTAMGDISSSAHDVIPFGESALVGNWSIRVLSVTADATDAIMAANEFNDPPGNGEQYFLVELEATYNGDASGVFWAETSLKLLGSSNVAYEGFNAFCGSIPDPVSGAGETFPGGVITGNECWSVASTEADGLVLIVDEAVSFDGSSRAVFSLSE